MPPSNAAPSLRRVPLLLRAQSRVLARTAATTAPRDHPSPGQPAIGIATHSGTFHADEALAVALLRRHPRFDSLGVTRTRDPAKLARATIVLDVGGVYDPRRFRFDHHQRSFRSTFDSNHTVRLSSAGLVWKHFGREILAHNFGHLGPEVETVWMKLYNDLIQSIDAIDNGVPIAHAPLRYHINTDLSSRIKRLNPRWNEDACDTLRDSLFAKASALAGQEAWDQVQDTVQAWIPARAVVKEAIEKREENVARANGQIVVLSRATMWKQHLFDVEQDLRLPYPILYVIYPDEASQWRVHAVPETETSFACRSVFCHASGFIGGNLTIEGAVSMARKALEWNTGVQNA